MILREKPELWECPTWHLDYGDVRSEFEHLRLLAIALLAHDPDLSVGLSVPEEGLMFLLIAPLNSESTTEIYSVQPDQGSSNRKYGIFLSSNSPIEEEHYALWPRAVIDLLESKGDKPRKRNDLPR